MLITVLPSHVHIHIPIHTSFNTVLEFATHTAKAATVYKVFSEAYDIYVCLSGWEDMHAAGTIPLFFFFSLHGGLSPPHPPFV